MIWFLRILFAGVIGSMLWVTSWASGQCAMLAIPREVFTHPWFIATLFDAYWGFITFFVWVAWKERATATRILWFLAIILLGNIAMASYVLRELFAVESSAGLDRVLTQRNAGHLVLPSILTVLSVAVYWLAWPK
jgi:hypothetical protein